MSTVQAFTENEVNLDAFFFCLPVWPPKMVRILPVGDLCHAGLLHLGPSTAADEEGFLAGWMMMAGRCRCIPVEPVGPVGTRICVQKPVIALAQSIGVQAPARKPLGPLISGRGFWEHPGRGPSRGPAASERAAVVCCDSA